MSYCISITSTEHLPLENTLLVHYSITCSGTWELLQQNTAYRNVCDDYWVVMYPNIQHPRHSDFPISAGLNSVPATFAWNYGGIQGIGPENFDPAHSYLVQLGIYNTDCGLTGETGQTGTTGSGGGGSNTGVTGSGGSYLSGGTWSPRYTPPPDVPFQNAPILPVEFEGPTIITNGSSSPIGPSLGHFAPSQSAFPTITTPIITSTSTSVLVPTALNPIVGTNQNGEIFGSSTNPIGTSINAADPGILNPGGSSSPIEPNNQIGTLNQLFNTISNGGLPGISPTGPNTTNSNTVGLPWETNVNGGETPHGGVMVNNISNLLAPQIIAPTISRPSYAPVGGISFENSNQAIGRRHNSIASQPGLDLPEDLTSSSMDLGINTVPNFGNTEGYLSRYSFDAANVTDVSRTTNLTHINTSSIIPSSKTLLEIPNDDIPSGEKLFISSAFIPPPGIEVNATITLWILDSQGRTVKLGQKSSLAANTSGISLAYSANTYQSPTGTNTVLAIVTDIDDKVIGISSKKFVIRPALVSQALNSNDRLRESRNRTVYEGLPASLVDLVNITRDPFFIYVKDSSMQNFLLEKIPGSSDFFSAIAIVGPSVSSRYLMTVFSSIKIGRVNIIDADGDGEEDPVEGESFIYSESTAILAQSSNRIQLDGEDLYPQSHTVGIPRTPTTVSDLIFSIGNNDAQTIDNKIIKIYLSDSYRLKPISVTVTTSVVLDESDIVNPPPTYLHVLNGSTPYVSTKIGILLHGSRLENIGTTSSSDVTFVTTNALGSFSLTDASLQYGDYFSILEPRYGSYNPYKNVVYTSKI